MQSTIDLRSLDSVLARRRGQFKRLKSPYYDERCIVLTLDQRQRPTTSNSTTNDQQRDLAGMVVLGVGVLASFLHRTVFNKRLGGGSLATNMTEDKVKIHLVAVGSAPILKKAKFQIGADQRWSSGAFVARQPPSPLLSLTRLLRSPRVSAQDAAAASASILSIGLLPWSRRASR